MGSTRTDRASWGMLAVAAGGGVGSTRTDRASWGMLAVAAGGGVGSPMPDRSSLGEERGSRTTNTTAKAATRPPAAAISETSMGLR